MRSIRIKYLLYVLGYKYLFASCHLKGTLSDDINQITWSLILALGVCYQARLQDRGDYREAVGKAFRRPCILPGGPDRIEYEITRLVHCRYYNLMGEVAWYRSGDRGGSVVACTCTRYINIGFVKVSSVESISVINCNTSLHCHLRLELATNCDFTTKFCLTSPIFP